MLVRTILLPSVFRVNPEKSNAEYGMVIGFLQKLEGNGIVLVNDTNYRRAIKEDIDQWPIKFRKDAKELLTALYKKGRFVEKSLNDTVQADCQNQQCQKCIRMAKIYLPPAIISSVPCNKYVAKELTELQGIEIVDIAEYSISKFVNENLNQKDHLFVKDELKPKEFEEKILIPLLRDAKHVKIYDRYIGRSILKNKNANEYKLTIKWILDVFLGDGCSKLKGVFEVYGGIHSPHIPPDKIQNAIDKLRALETEFKQVYPNFKLMIKDETKGEEMPHDRFLVTNQVAVSVGRGFNLLFDSQSRLQDVTISYCSEPGKIEQAVKNLPDL